MARLKLLILTLILLATVTSSSFTLTTYFSTGRDTPTQPSLIKISAERKVTQAYALYAEQFQLGSKSWLFWHGKSAEHYAASARFLANYYLTQLPKNLTLAEYWLKQAINLGDNHAHTLLAQLYFSQEKYQLSQHQLRLAPASDDHFLVNYQLAVVNGQSEYLKQKYNKLNSLAKINQQAALLIEQISRYQILPVNKQLNETFRCPNPVQIFASDFSGLTHAEALIKKQQDNVNFSQHFCFPTPKYLPRSEITCQLNKDSPILCDEQAFKHVKVSDEVRYLVLIVDEGEANVNRGIMYLDKRDDEQVFAHELLHFLGFVDEYPLPTNHKLCQQNLAKGEIKYLAINAAITHGGSKVNTAKDISRALKDYPIHDDSDWHKSTTCELSPLQAWKPTSQSTQLAYYQYDTPAEYWQLVEDLDGYFAMPSYHYNVARALAALGQDTQSLIWRQKAMDKENHPKRIEKIRLGRF